RRLELRSALLPPPWLARAAKGAACPIPPGCMGRNFVARAKGRTALHTRKNPPVSSPCDGRLSAPTPRTTVRVDGAAESAAQPVCRRPGTLAFLLHVPLDRMRPPTRTTHGAGIRHAKAHRKPRRQIQPRREPTALDRHPGDRAPNASSASPGP